MKTIFQCLARYKFTNGRACLHFRVKFIQINPKQDKIILQLFWQTIYQNIKPIMTFTNMLVWGWDNTKTKSPGCSLDVLKTELLNFSSLTTANYHTCSLSKTCNMMYRLYEKTRIYRIRFARKLFLLAQCRFARKITKRDLLTAKLTR